MIEPDGSASTSDAGVPASEVETDDARVAEVAKLGSYVVFLIAAIVLYVSASGLPTSRWEPLGSGAFPKLVMALLGLLCVVAISLSLRRLRRIGLPGQWSRRIVDFIAMHRLVIGVFVAFGIYLVAMRTLGFSLSTFLFLLAAQLIVAPRSTRTVVTALLVAIVFSFGLNWLFAEGFTVFLPRGFLG